MKALTVQQPWAWTIAVGAKTVENRTRVWTHRGPLAIHAGARLSERGCFTVPGLLDATRPDLIVPYAEARLAYSAVIGVVDVTDAHVARVGCCESPWGEQVTDEHHVARRRNRITHLVVDNARMLDDPVPCGGRLGLWDLPGDVEDTVRAMLSVSPA